MKTYPFRLLGRSTVDFLVTRAQQSLERWRSDWMLETKFTVACAAATKDQVSDINAADWRQHQLLSGVSVWIYAQPTLLQSIENIIFGKNKIQITNEPNQPSCIALGVAKDAQKNLFESIIHGLTEQTSQSLLSANDQSTFNRLFQKGSATALCTIKFHHEVINLLLPYISIPKTAKSGEENQSMLPLKFLSLHHALTNTFVTLKIEVGDAELTLGHLNTLAVGDVLRLDSSLDGGISVFGPGTLPICNAHLGKLADSYAIELTK